MAPTKYKIGEKVTIKRSYAYKPVYAGKHGLVEFVSKTKVTIRLENNSQPPVTLSQTCVQHGWI
jgi:hypothetical protein